MPDYYRNTKYADAPGSTYDFASAKQVPDAIFINLGSNDISAIETLGEDVGGPLFTNQTVEFMVNATKLYSKSDIEFFLNAGPIENMTLAYTLDAISQAKELGIRATYIDTTDSCVSADDHGSDNPDQCDGCANHPGVEGHKKMYEAALPVIQNVLGWD